MASLFFYLLFVSAMSLVTFFFSSVFVSYISAGNAKAVQLHALRIRTKDMPRDQYGKSDHVGLFTSTD